MIYQVNKPFHLSTNPEILMKIGPLDSEEQLLESQLLNIYVYIYKIKKNILLFSQVCRAG